MGAPKAFHPTGMDHFICLRDLNHSYTDKSTMHRFLKYINLVVAQ